MAARLTPDQKVGSSNLSALISFHAAESSVLAWRAAWETLHPEACDASGASGGVTQSSSSHEASCS